ncbi:hypothetical protein [Microbacterium sp. CGR1]|uniref:hypothetical protein n=1 Tax=Microbacterium sp. CGR1 TaxID=1696072 RepID=UPI003DA2D19A
MSLFAVSLGTSTDGDAAGRTSGHSGSLFGEALTTAGQMLAAPDGESATSPGAEGESEAGAVDGRPGSAAVADLEGDAASTALIQLAAHLRPAAPGEEPTADSDVTEGGSDDAPLAVVGSVGISATATETETVAPESADASAIVSAQPEGERVPMAAGTMLPAAAAPVDGSDGDAASSAPALASSASAVASSASVASGAQLSSGPESPGVESAGRPAPVSASGTTASSSGLALGASHTNPSSNETAVRVESGERAPSASTPQTSPSAAPVAPPQNSVTPAAPVSAPETAPANRAVAAQVSPVVVSVAQRPMGTHHLTMTVNPDSLGPVTVRAHISASGEVQVELSGATDAGRDALRGILVDLRRDLAAVMPHATLSVTQSSAADANGDRSGQTAGDAAAREQGSGDRDASRGRSEQRPGAERASDLPRLIQTTPHAGIGAGLDIFA